MLAGVAISSASRALSDSPSVSAELRARVAAAALELGYRPNLLARGLRKGASLSVGFVVRDISNSLFAEIALGAETALRARGYSMLLTNSEGRSDLDLAHLRLFRQRSVDGLLLSLADETHAATLDELEQLRVPIVLIDREVERPAGLSAVLCDHGAGVADACAWLAGLGHRRIGLVGRPAHAAPGTRLRRRARGLRGEGRLRARDRRRAVQRRARARGLRAPAARCPTRPAR